MRRSFLAFALLGLMAACANQDPILILADACDTAAGAIRVAAAANTAPRQLKPEQVRAVDLAAPVVREACHLPPPTDVQTALMKVRNAVAAMSAVGVTKQGVQ